MLALKGIKVIEASQGIPGPLCAMTLAEFGAKVTKVEPRGGDWMRQVGPFENAESALFVRLNRNKKGVCLDLKNSEGREIFRNLARTADVVLEGYRTGVMDKLGLGYELLSQDNPRLIYCSISGYGSQGPMAELPASELDIQALLGQFRRLGTADGHPFRAGYDMVATVAAWSACQGIMAAIFSRLKTGEGQKVETSVLDAGVAMMQFSFAAESNPDEWVGGPLNGYTDPPAYGYRCRNASFIMDLDLEDKWWGRFCATISAQAILEDPRFSTFRQRQRNQPALTEELTTYLSDWKFEELQKLVQGMGGTLVRMHDAETLFHDPQTHALEIVKELKHPSIGKYKTLNIPWKFSEPIAELSPIPAPLLGQHNDEVLGELGYSAELTDTLKGLGVIGNA